VPNLTGNKEVFEPTFSPDGTHIAFRGANEAGGNAKADLWVQSFNVSKDVVSGLATEVSTTGSSWMHWSHKGLMLAFRGNGVSNEHAEVWVVSIPKTGPPGTPQLVTALGSGNFSWSPDDTTLAVEGQPGGTDTKGVIELFVVNPCCTGPTALTNGLQNDFRPAFAPH
jgi:Tol biopolymer transport system component